MCMKRRNSANESYSIIGFLSRRVKGSRDRLFSEDLMSQQANSYGRTDYNGGKF
jgi:hypothetical protein